MHRHRGHRGRGDRWIADLIAPLLDGPRLFATVGMFLVGLVANFLLTLLATLATLTGPFAQIGMDLGLSANVVAYSLIYGADQYLFSLRIRGVALLYLVGLPAARGRSCSSWGCGRCRHPGVPGECGRALLAAAGPFLIALQAPAAHPESR